MRVVIVGTAGAGKTTLARRLARELDLRHVELDAINWQPGWRALYEEDLPDFSRRVAEATAGERWVCDGAYGRVRDVLWPRATHLVWLDLPRGAIMRQVIVRSLGRGLSRKPLFNGNREDLRQIFEPDSPVRTAWTNFHLNRARYEAALAQPEHSHLTVIRIARRRDVAGVGARIRGSCPA
jgi:adenylate kinase family enzyme